MSDDEVVVAPSSATNLRPGCRYRAATGEPQRPGSGDRLDHQQRVKRLACGAGDAEQGGCSRSVWVCLDDYPGQQPRIVGSRCGGPGEVMQTRDGRNKQDLARPQVSDPQCGKARERRPTAMTQTATTTTTTIPERMRASVLTGAKTLSIEQVPTPPMASDEVLVEVAAVGVCGSDTHYYRHGRIGDFVVTAPLILGHELSGRIVAVGEEVPETRIGERVAIEPQKNCRKCRECRAGHYNLCPNMEFYATPPIDGAFAEYCVIEPSSPTGCRTPCRTRPPHCWSRSRWL